MQLINKKVLLEGNRGRSVLAMAINRSERMVDRFRKGQSCPSQEQIVRLALACGLTEDEAVALASEGSDGQRTAG